MYPVTKAPTLGPVEGKGTETWQRALLLRFRDEGDTLAKAELLATLAGLLQQRVDDMFADEDPEVRERLVAVARSFLDPLVSYIPLGRIRAAGRIDLIAETLDPDELADELVGDGIGDRALAALVARTGTGDPGDAITSATSEQRSRIIDRLSGLLLPLIAEHHVRGRLGVDHSQADLDRVEEMTGKAMSRISVLVRELPDRVILDDPDSIEQRLVGDRKLSDLIGFDPSEGFARNKADAEAVAERAAAIRARTPKAADRQARGLGTRRAAISRRPRSAVVAQSGLPRLEPAPRPPSVLDTLSSDDEQRLLAIMRDNNEAWARGDTFMDSERRDQYWDPVTVALEQLDDHSLQCMIELGKVGRIRVLRGYLSEIERVLGGKAQS